MITRDNKASISGIAQNARQRLGEVIRHHRTERQWSTYDVSRRAKIAIANVEAWEAGRLVPNTDEWKALCRGIHRSLHAFNDLRQRALEEQRTEQATITRSIEVHTNGSNGHRANITTNLGDKIRDVSLPSIASSPKPAPDSPTAIRPTPAPDARTVNPGQAVTYQPTEQPLPQAAADLGQTPRGFAADGRRLSPVRPAGASAYTAIERRRRFVRELLAAFPNKRTNGADSVIELVRKTFGIGISPEYVDAIREELKTERIKAEVRAEMGAPPKPDDKQALQKATDEHERKHPAAPIATAEVNHGDLEAAVQLVLGAVPNLQTFTISVDENGDASIDYQIRKVTITTEGGTLKVRRS